jgi:hypothetical protein
MVRTVKELGFESWQWQEMFSSHDQTTSGVNVVASAIWNLDLSVRG